MRPAVRSRRSWRHGFYIGSLPDRARAALGIRAGSAACRSAADNIAEFGTQPAAWVTRELRAALLQGAQLFSGDAIRTGATAEPFCAVTGN